MAGTRQPGHGTQNATNESYASFNRQPFRTVPADCGEGEIASIGEKQHPHDDDSIRASIRSARTKRHPRKAGSRNTASRRTSMLRLTAQMPGTPVAIEQARAMATASRGDMTCNSQPSATAMFQAGQTIDEAAAQARGDQEEKCQLHAVFQ